ncbi:ornithine decarboxylase 1 [Drosophila grimshawi]|uniref:ornithine decarboxylase n=1 Tax=Drosophila grimshawi TaxID=7222 RepID=B4J828_DROGR|nr:ornithine decarboxylase 1 [Drosophila grimshawi]EDW02258.1 GH21896 [Drosophila grimshawi]
METKGINYYEKVLDIRRVIDEARVQDSDEALNICDLSTVERMFQLWQQNMPRVKPFYAVKCNDDPLILQTLAKLGAGFDCASKNEMKQVLDLDVEPERIIFANPCRPISHLEYAKKNQVLKCAVDNEFEIYKLHKHFPNSNLIVRFKSEAKKAQCPLGDKFGCDADIDASALMLLAKSLNLTVTGISFHVGSGCMESQAYERAIRKAKNLFKFGELLGYDMNLLDIGGGFPGSNDEQFEKIAESINKAVQRYFPDERIKIISEPGRFFVAAAYTLVCKIHAKREVRDEAGKLDTVMYYLNDGVYGLFNCVLYDHQQVTAQHYLNDDSSLPTFKSLIWGPSCDALDKISENVSLPNLNRGDILGFPNMGAYTVPIASAFNGFPLARTLYFKAK